MTLLEFRKRNDVAELSVLAAEVDMYREVFSAIAAALKPKVIHLDKSKLL